MKKKGKPLPNLESIRKFDQASASEKRRKKWTLALCISTISGFSFSLLGLDMCGLAYLGIVENAKTINQIGTWLIFIAFPLIMFGAHCLDKIEDIKKKTQNIRWRRKLEP